MARKQYDQIETEKKLAALERAIDREYRQAYYELADKTQAFFKQFEAKVKDLEQKLKDGTYPMPNGVSAHMTPEQHFKQWKLNQMAIGERWEKLRDEMAKRYTQANETAAKYVNDTTPQIYSLNHNYACYQISEAYDMGKAFTMINEQAVKEMLEDKNHINFRVLHTDRPRDYKWNTKRIQSELTSAILQGKSVKGITDAFYSVMGNNRKAAIRNARTAITSAENAGHLDAYQEAEEEYGIEILNEWVCTLDDKTRQTHRDLDGQRVAQGEKFKVTNDKDKEMEIEYPGDPEAEPELVYNCRCRIIPILPGINDNRDVPRAYKRDGHREFDGDRPKTADNVTYEGRENTMSFKEFLQR